MNFFLRCKNKCGLGRGKRIIGDKSWEYKESRIVYTLLSPTSYLKYLVVTFCIDSFYRCLLPMISFNKISRAGSFCMIPWAGCPKPQLSPITEQLVHTCCALSQDWRLPTHLGQCLSCPFDWTRDTSVRMRVLKYSSSGILDFDYSSFWALSTYGPFQGLYILYIWVKIL